MEIDKKDSLGGGSQGNDVFSRKIRWLAVLAACSSAVFGPSALGSPFLILGAVIQPRAPTTGKWLAWLGALLLSIIVIPFGSGTVFEDARLLLSGHNIANGWLFPLFLVATSLVLCCDIVLVTDALASRHNLWRRGSLDWLVWVAALVLSAWAIWLEAETVRAYRRQGGLRTDIVFTRIGLTVLFLLFDLALVVHWLRGRRSS
jgi:hypothetical protein